MEHGTISDPSSSTFSITDEDHTLANSVRFTLNKDPRVTFCGYSIPHPSENRVNIRVQTTGIMIQYLDLVYMLMRQQNQVGSLTLAVSLWQETFLRLRNRWIPHGWINRNLFSHFYHFAGDPAKDVLKDALQDLMNMCQHVRGTFDKAVEDFKTSQPMEQMNLDP